MEIKQSQIDGYIMGRLGCDKATASKVADDMWLDGVIGTVDEEDIDDDTIMTMPREFDFAKYLPAPAMDKIQSAYAASAGLILQQVAKLQDFADKLHDIAPDDVTWSQVAELGRVEILLAELLEVAK